MVLTLPVALRFAKSAKFASIAATAAQPPWFCNSDRRNSLNQTSPHNSVLVSLRTPIIATRTSPKLGFPFIPTLSMLDGKPSIWPSSKKCNWLGA